MHFEDLMQIKIYADCRTQPYVPSGTGILLIQNSYVTIGKLFYIEEDSSSIYIDHPKNENILSAQALKIIEEKRPDLLKSEEALMVTCPADLQKSMIWE